MRCDQRIFRKQKLLIMVLCMILGIPLSLGTGCAPVTKELGTRFFPLPPDPPKIQFLKRIASSSDVETQSRFQSFITGPIPPKRFGKPYGIGVYDGIIYVCDVRLGTMVMVDLINETFELFPDKGPGDMQRPLSMTIDKDGNKYVSDYMRHQVLVYNKENKFVRSLGDRDLFKPAGIAVHGGKVYVADVRDHEIEVLDSKTGEHLFVIGEPGLEEAQFYSPTNMAVGPEGSVYVTDTISCNVEQFDPDGNHLFAFGKCANSIGNFARPKGIAVSDDGFVYVVDAAFENVQIFTSDGELALFFGGFGESTVPGALWLPAGITITRDEKLMNHFNSVRHKDFNLDYLILVTSQYGPPYFNIYGFGEAAEGTPLSRGEGDVYQPDELESKTGVPEME